MGERGNRAERAFIASMEAAGVGVCRRGWPDFWWTDEHHRLCVAEVKPHAHYGLRREQLRILTLLYKFGVLTYTWTPESGLRPFIPLRGGHFSA